MMKIVTKTKSLIALLPLWLLCQNAYSKSDVINSLEQTIDCVYTINELSADTLTDNEQRRKDIARTIEEMEFQLKVSEAELKATQDWERLVPNKSQMEQNSFSSSKTGKESSGNNSRPVVFGIRAGANLASLGINGDVDGKCTMVTSFHAGLNLDIRLIDQLHLNTSLLFSQKGYKYENNKDRERQETAKAQFIMLPVQLSIRIGAFQLNAGPYIEYGFGGEIEYGQGWKYDTFKYYDTMQYGITAGIGANLGKHFYLGANYEFGLSGYANRNIAISLGVNF